MHSLQGHAAAITHITINERSNQIISLSSDKVIKVPASALILCLLLHDSCCRAAEPTGAGLRNLKCLTALDKTALSSVSDVESAGCFEVATLMQVLHGSKHLCQ